MLIHYTFPTKPVNKKQRFANKNDNQLYTTPPPANINKNNYYYFFLSCQTLTVWLNFPSYTQKDEQMNAPFFRLSLLSLTLAAGFAH
ncbi:TPA: hypothetical protein ACKJ8O_001218, partial [Neisseria gonorrhoeae]